MHRVPGGSESEARARNGNTSTGLSYVLLPRRASGKKRLTFLDTVQESRRFDSLYR